jgi:hypothetical protein
VFCDVQLASWCQKSNNALFTNISVQIWPNAASFIVVVEKYALQRKVQCLFIPFLALLAIFRGYILEKKVGCLQR